MAYLIRFPILGFCPCIKIQVRKIRPPAHSVNAVNNATPVNPAMGCHIGMVTGVDCLISISIGVKGGNNDNPVAKLPNGSFITGIMTNSGRITGSMAGNCSDWASLLSLHAEPMAAIPEPTMIIFRIRKLPCIAAGKVKMNLRITRLHKGPHTMLKTIPADMKPGHMYFLSIGRMNTMSGSTRQLSKLKQNQIQKSFAPGSYVDLSR